MPLRAQASYAQLVSHLTPADGDAPATAATAPHVWVQMRDGTDWVDLDPWSPATAYGDHPAGQGTLMGDPPEAASVTLTLSVETMTAEAELSTDTILSATLDMPDAADTVVALYFGPDLSGTGAGVVGVLNAINGQAGTMAAYLTINGDTQKSSAFPLPGPVTAAADGFFADGTAALTTAMTLRVTSHVPGQADHVETRPILDLIPPALRLPGAAAPTLADLLPVTPGQQYPAALESLRSILISNGGTPRRHLAASEAMQIVGLYQRMQRDDPDFATIYDAVWTSALEAGRVQFAAEELIRARPAHDGACATIDRPRVMIAGVGTASQGRILRWLDWVIDDVTLRGGNATAQAEARLWHGAMQAALEKEALMQQIMLPDDAVPLDSAAMQPMDAARLVATGPEAADDAAKDYTVLTAADLAPDSWWRLDPVTGQADARVRLWGNGFWNYTNTTPNSGPRIPVPEDPRLANLEGDAVWRRIYADEARRRAAAAAAQPKCGGNEYMILATCVSIPGSIAVGLLVGTITVYGVYSYATAGP